MINNKKPSQKMVKKKVIVKFTMKDGTVIKVPGTKLVRKNFDGGKQNG